MLRGQGGQSGVGLDASPRFSGRSLLRRCLTTSWQDNTFHGIDAFTSGGARDQPGFLVVGIRGSEMTVMERRRDADVWHHGNVAVVALAAP